MPSDGSPAILVYHYLKPYIPNNIVLIELEYNFGSSAGRAQYDAAIKSIIKRLEKGDLKACVYFYYTHEYLNKYLSDRYTSFAVHILDHTDPERGDLHFAPDEKGSAAPLTVSNLS